MLNLKMINKMMTEEIIRTEFDLACGERYRQAPKGDSSPTMPKWQDFEKQRKAKPGTKTAAATKPQPPTLAAATPTTAPTDSQKEASGDALSAENEVFVRAANEYYSEGVAEGHRHETFISELAPWVLMRCDNDLAKALVLVEHIDWVKKWTDRAPDELENVLQTVSQRPLLRKLPKRLTDLMAKHHADVALQKAVSAGVKPMDVLPFEQWCDTIESFFDVYPCLREVCEPHPRRLWPFLLFASAAMMGTCMDLTYYYFYASESERTRLNYIIWGVGDPTSGKHSLERLMNLLLAPIIAEGEIADESTNTWKESTDAKGANKEKDLRPAIYNRMFGYRSSNAEFIRSMINCKEEVDGEMMGRHMVTVSSEKDLEIGKSGSWISRSNMILLSFHGEYDDQHFSNKQSVSGRYRVFWNMMETFTPPTLAKLVNERTVNSGLDTRTATIPMGEDDFKMMPLRRREKSKTAEYNESLRQWSYRLEGRRGELPIWPLVEHVHKWCDGRRAIAEFNDRDKADWVLIKRVPYYGISISVPYIDMRHWEEREQTGTYQIDDTDLALCDLVLDIQYRTQIYWYYELHRMYYDNQLREAAQQRRRSNKFKECYRQLPQEFTNDVFTQVFGYANNRSGQKTLNRLLEDKAIKRNKRGSYTKLVTELP